MPEAELSSANYIKNIKQEKAIKSNVIGMYCNGVEGGDHENQRVSL